jgi:hypothetical protein
MHLLICLFLNAFFIAYSQPRRSKDSKSVADALNMDLESLLKAEGRRRKPRGGRRSAGHRDGAGEEDVDMGEAEVRHVTHAWVERN